MIHAPNAYKEQGSYFASDINDFRVEQKKEHGMLLGQPLLHPPTSNNTSLNRKPLKGTLKMFDKDTEA